MCILNYRINVMVEVSTSLAAASLTFSVLSFLILTLGLILWQFPDLANSIRSIMNLRTTSGQTGLVSNISTLVVILGALSPDISLLIGFVSDIMNGSFRYSVTSIVGVLAVVVHWLIGRFLLGYNVVTSVVSSMTSAVPTPIQRAVDIGVGVDNSSSRRSSMSSLQESIRGSTEAPDLVPRSPASSTTFTERERSGPSSALRRGIGSRNLLGGSYIQEKLNPCTIRGLGMFELSNSPMGMAALSAMFMIYMLDMTTKRTLSQMGGYIGFATAVLAVNLYAYKEAKCVADTSFLGLLKGILLPTAVGLAVGGISYGVLKSNYPEFLPLNAEPFDEPSSSGGSHARCGKPSENEFVCDAYKDGKKISTSVVA